MSSSLPVLNVGSVDAGRVARDLETLIEGEVRFGRHDRLLYATDASIYQVEPIGVVIPRSIDELERVVRYCGAAGVPLLARGGGTSLAGQTVNAAIVLDLSRHCSALLEIDASRRQARVQPGLVLDVLNQALQPHGLMFGPDVATSTHATLGGMIGNNSAGAHSILYGRTVEHLRGLEVVLADGTRLHLEEGASEHDPRTAELTRRVAEVVRRLEPLIDARFPRTQRRVDGYNLDLVLDQLRRSTPGTFDRVNLAHLFCGAEGTLGVTLEAEVALVRAPAARGLGIVGFPSVDDALVAVQGVLETAPAAVELLDDAILKLAAENIEYRRYLELLPQGDGPDAAALLYVEYFADGPDEIRGRLRDLETAFGHGIVKCHVDATAMGRAWKLRKAGEPLLYGQPGRRKPLTFIEDCAVRPADLPRYVTRVREIMAAHGTTAAYYAHASVGCLHIRPMICLSDPVDRRAMQEIASEMTDLVMTFGGALSGEHGDGRLRSHLLRRFYGPEICDGFRAIKALFDPRDLMNPGNITRPADMTASLRADAAQDMAAVAGLRTYFRYGRERGFAAAVEMCNGAGVCRKTSGGAMCPSYRVTRDERHATRGRGNALRLAVTGQFGGVAPLWNDPETLETLDLCLGCKACKAECPSNVDVARLKSEYLAQSYDRAGGPPLAARVFGHVRRLSRLGSVSPRLANAVARNPLSRRLASAALGIDRRRSLPPFAPSLYRWFRSRPRPATGGPAVILLPDCFTVYSEPGIGRAAVQCLETLGYRVILPETGCCGRAMISVGLLPDAVRVCEGMARKLLEQVEQSEVVGVVSCEPSCLSAVIDDWLDLDTGVCPDGLRRLAERAWLVEDFVESRWPHHPVPPALDQRLETEILLHGHCHQQALGGLDEPVRLLNRLTKGQVHALDCGCCGLAGGFGYGRGHFDLSMAIAELSLLPALRRRPEATIVTSGTSCRHQIRDALAGERCVAHPVELLARTLRAGRG